MKDFVPEIFFKKFFLQKINNFFSVEKNRESNEFLSFSGQSA